MKHFLDIFAFSVFWRQYFCLEFFQSFFSASLRECLLRLVRVQEQSSTIHKGAKSSSVQSMQEDFIKKSLIVPVFYDGIDAGVDVAELFGRF